MAIQNINYWDSTNSQTKLKKENGEDKVKIKETLDKYETTFNKTLFDILSGNQNDNMWNNAIPGLSADPLLGNHDIDALNKEIENAQAMGLEKVLAERLKTPLPFLNQTNYADNSKSNNPLDRMTDLTMQLHLARAKRAITQQNTNNLLTIDAFINKDLQEKDQIKIDGAIEASDANKQSEMIAPIQNIKTQIDELARTLALSYESIVDLLGEKPRQQDSPLS